MSARSDLQLATVAHFLNRLPMVRWDRLMEVSDGDDIEYTMKVYGWIDRDDGRSDFVILDFGNLDERVMVGISPEGQPPPGFSTSSAMWDPVVHAMLYEGTNWKVAPVGEYPCERVEAVLGDLVENAIRLG